MAKPGSFRFTFPGEVEFVPWTSEEVKRRAVLPCVVHFHDICLGVLLEYRPEWPCWHFCDVARFRFWVCYYGPGVFSLFCWERRSQISMMRHWKGFRGLSCTRSAWEWGASPDWSLWIWTFRSWVRFESALAYLARPCFAEIDWESVSGADRLYLYACDGGEGLVLPEAVIPSGTWDANRVPGSNKVLVLEILFRKLV